MLHHTTMCTSRIALHTHKTAKYLHGMDTRWQGAPLNTRAIAWKLHEVNLHTIFIMFNSCKEVSSQSFLRSSSTELNQH